MVLKLIFYNAVYRLLPSFVDEIELRKLLQAVEMIVWKHFFVPKFFFHFFVLGYLPKDPSVTFSWFICLCLIGISMIIFFRKNVFTSKWWNWERMELMNKNFKSFDIWFNFILLNTTKPWDRELQSHLSWTIILIHFPQISFTPTFPS